MQHQHRETHHAGEQAKAIQQLPERAGVINAQVAVEVKRNAEEEVTDRDAEYEPGLARFEDGGDEPVVERSPAP